jgi:branched-chain amino acid transport system permease protein
MTAASLLRRAWPVLALATILIVLVVIIDLMGVSIAKLAATEALVKMVVVIGLYIFIGNTGIVSFGHISFMAIGAYMAAWLTCCPAVKGTLMHGLPDFIIATQVPNLPTALVAGAAAALFALFIGSALMRLTGIAPAIAMFGVLMIVYVGYSAWDSVTLGRSSIFGLPTYIDHWVALWWVLAALATAYLYQISRWGLAAIAARDDEFAAKAAGINIYRMRLISFVLSGFFVGIGGALFAHFLGGVSTSLFYLDMTFLTLAMLVVGGMNSLSGAVLGVVALSTVIEVLRRFESGVDVGIVSVQLPSGAQEIALAVIMLLVLIFRPTGITRSREILFPWPFGRPVPITMATGQTSISNVDDTRGSTPPN